MIWPFSTPTPPPMSGAETGAKNLVMYNGQSFDLNDPNVSSKFHDATAKAAKAGKVMISGGEVVDFNDINARLETVAKTLQVDGHNLSATKAKGLAAQAVDPDVQAKKAAQEADRSAAIAKQKFFAKPAPSTTPPTPSA